MTRKKALRDLSMKTVKNERGISTVISTIIVSGALLIILVIASFVSGNILGLQIASTEFEQAKTNMMLLDEVIQDVALRRGSGGYVQFNQRSGGLNVVEKADGISIYVDEGLIYESPALISLDYRGGSYASSTDMVMRGNDSLIIRDLNHHISHLRVETGQGLWIKLDYHRVRIVEMGTLVVDDITHNYIEITHLQLERGNMGGSENVNVKVQNVAINTTSYIYDGGSVSIRVDSDSKTPETCSFSAVAEKSVIILIEVRVKISTA